MKTFAVRATIISAVLALGVFALAGSAGAAHVTATVTVVQQAAVGQPADVQVTLRTADQNTSVANVPVTFYTDETFAKVKGEVVLGRSVTNAKGVADLTFQPRVAGQHEIRAEFSMAGDSQPEAATAMISVAGSTSQLYQSTAGVQIPGLSVWLLIAVVTTIWAILLSVALRIIAIARAGRDDALVAPVPTPRVGAAEPIPSSSGAGGAR